MRRIVAALAVAAAPLFLASPARAADDPVCKDLVGLEQARITELAADIAIDQALEKRLLDAAAANEKAATLKDEQAKKFKAAADATTDPKKKKAFLEIVALLEGGANRDRTFAKDLKEGAGRVSKAQQQAQTSLDARTAALQRLRQSCNLTLAGPAQISHLIVLTPPDHVIHEVVVNVDHRERGSEIRGDAHVTPPCFICHP